MSDTSARIFVGLGASAGGIEACRGMLQAVPEDSGAAFIVILHLDPKRSSHIAEILQSSLPRLVVVQATGRERMQPQHVYVIAPNSKLSISDGTLEVDVLAENEPRAGLVDYLFASLAEADGDRSVGVVLSGAGHDGTTGLQAIRNAGGLCIAQEPVSAGTSSMPQSAIDAGVVDTVLPLADIWPALDAFAKDGSRPELRADGSGRRQRDGDAATKIAADSGFGRILRALSDQADINFDDYKTGTLERRARRRMGLKNIADWDAYAERLADDPDELEALYRDVLIGVTAFFRDSEVWEFLAGELKPLIDRREDPGLRIWVPGCATGEEAYSLAILAREQVRASESKRIQIYATDVNSQALAVARRGVYPAESLQHVAAERRERHFLQRDGQLQVNRDIRDCVTFAPHNVMSDPPFSNMDIVSCRNLLIYLKPQAHDRLLRRLHFALRHGGLLVLGRAERLGREGKLFDEISKNQSVFRARIVSREQRFQVAPQTRTRIHSTDQAAIAPSPYQAQWTDGASERRDRRIEQYVLRQHTTASAVINSDRAILHLYGPTDRYLLPPIGESRQDLLAWIRPGFYIRLRSALVKAIASQERTDAQGEIEYEDEVQRVRCTVLPLPVTVGVDGLFLVSFDEVAEARRPKANLTDTDEPVVRDLERDLHETRRELQVAVEQLETAGEEHRASNEEQLALNEELQSSNEELEASKEELEALNEEMNTINRELEQKNAALREANSDLHNLFLSTAVPALFLDRDLRIRRFTNAATDVMCLVSSDVGRSIEYVKERYDDSSTADRARRVLETLEPDSTEVRTADGHFYMRRILPYRTDDGEVDGVSITFADVTEQRHAAQESESARRYSEAIIRTARTPMLVVDKDLRIESFNDGFRKQFDVDDTIIGLTLSEIRDRRWNIPRLHDVLAPVISEGTTLTDYEVASRDRCILIDARPVATGDGGTRAVLSFEDVTAHRAARSHALRRATELKEDADRKDLWIAMLGHELRNPVGAISNGIALMKSSKLGVDEQRKTVEMMAQQLHQIARLLDELLDAARIIAGKLEIEKNDVDLTRASERAADTTRPLMEQNQHRFSVDLPPVGTVWVEGDAVRLTEVIVNLLTNAAKYTDAGGRITLDVSAAGDDAVIRVRDTGVGIPDDLKEHIFEVFTQGPRSLGRHMSGLGLGLPLVKSLVESHQGRVEVLSEGSGKGSEFRITLPRLHREAGANVDDEADNIEQVRTSSRRILIVDDLRDAAESLAKILQGYGDEVRLAGSGPEALKVVREYKPEFALLDIGLPDMDGYELAQHLRRELPDSVLIAITGYVEDAARLAKAGFDHHLIKPVDMKSLQGLLAAENE